MLIIKKNIIIVLVLSFLILSGCKDDSTTNPSESSEMLWVAESISMNIFYPQYISHVEASIMSSIQIEAWENYLRDICELDMKFKYIDIPLKAEKFSETGTEGLVYIWDISQLKKLMECELILPLNDYLKNSENAGAIDENIIANFTDDSGNIWALPTYSMPTYSYRRYNNEWLKQLKFETPKTIADFEKLGRIIKENGFGDSKKDTYLFDIRYPHKFTCYELMDIFIAFGCYPNMMGLSNVSYNNTKGNYEDIVFTEEFTQALTYIRFLIEEDLVIYTENMSQHDIHENYDFISGNNIEHKSEIEVGFYLSGNNTKNLLFENIYLNGVAVLKNTKNVKEKIEFFTKRAFVDEEIRTALNHGVSGYHYDEFETYYMKYLENNGRLILFSPILINILSSIENEKDIYIEGKTYEENSQRADLVKKGYLLFLKARENNKGNIYSYDLLKRIHIDESLKNDSLKEGIQIYPIDLQISMNFISLLGEVFSGDKTVDEAIKEYREKCNNAEYSEYFNKLNN